MEKIDLNFKEKKKVNKQNFSFLFLVFFKFFFYFSILFLVFEKYVFFRNYFAIVFIYLSGRFINYVFSTQNLSLNFENFHKKFTQNKKQIVFIT